MKQKSIGFVLLSNRRAPVASTRISVLQMLPHLAVAGYTAEILFEPEEPTEEPMLPAELVERAARQGIDLVYFQKVHGPSAIAAATALRRHGIRSVYGVCDLVEDEMAQACDATIAISDYLKSLYDPRLQDRIFVVHDGIERPDLYQRSYRMHVGSARKPLRAALVTGQALLEIPILGKLPRFIDLTVIGRHPPRLLSAEGRAALSGQLASQPGLAAKSRSLYRMLRPGFRRETWNASTVHQRLLDFDLGIIPIDRSPDPIPGRPQSWWQLKSENRLTLKMAAGLPVIATPIPAYENEIIITGENGFLAETLDDWLAALELLRDPGRRAAIGQAARRTVIERFSPQEQARRLLGVLEGVFS